MKIISVPILSLLLSSFLFVNCKEDVSNESKFFTVSFLKGSAERLKQPSSLKPFDLLPSSESVKTGEGSVMDLSTSLGRVRMLGGTTTDLETLNQDELFLSVKEGNILVKAFKLNKGQSLKVATPTVVAAVRGTEFWGQVNPATESGTFAVRDGAVEITRKSDQVSIIIEKGQALDIDPKNKEWKTRPAKQGELDAMAQIDELK